MAYESRARPIRVGIIGTGNWARHGHLRVLSLLPEYKVLAVQARRREAAESAALSFQIPRVVDSVTDIVSMPDVDLVAVLTTAPQHEEGVRAAIAAGKDVYCEWPLTVSAEKAEELRDLANAARVRHVVGLQRRLAPHNRFLRDLLADGYVGRVRSVRLHVSMNYFQALRANALRWTIPPENFSSVVAIYAGHFLDMMFHAVGLSTAMSAMLMNQFAEVRIAETDEVFTTTTSDQLVAIGSLASGAVFSIQVEGGKKNGSGVQLDVTGDAGDLRITNRSAFGEVGDDYIVHGAHGNNMPLEMLPVPEKYNWLPSSNLPSAVLELANLYAAFAAGPGERTVGAPSFDDALWMHRFLEACDASSHTGSRVSAPATIPGQRTHLVQGSNAA